MLLLVRGAYGRYALEARKATDAICALGFEAICGRLVLVTSETCETVIGVTSVAILDSGG